MRGIVREKESKFCAIVIFYEFVQVVAVQPWVQLVPVLGRDLAN